tara:strand:+ start:1624 stop:2514 length:891 start_codon:yes stop_codon:yes gene_type:complete
MKKVRYFERPKKYWEGHVFPMKKMQLLKDRISVDFEVEFNEPEALPEGAVELTHDADFLSRIDSYFKNPEASYGEFEARCDSDVFENECRAVAGTLSSCRDALNQGWGFNIGGGLHHSFPDHGEGFCIINDVAISINQLRKEKVIKKAAVIDLDVHQGNGTAVCFQGIPEVTTISIHQQNNYPSWKPKSDLDLGLADGTGDDEYLLQLSKSLEWLSKYSKPDLILFLAGADPYRKDQLGGLSLTKKGLEARDKRVFNWARDNNCPVSVVLAGGYAKDVNDVVDIHFNTFKCLMEVY